MLLNAFVRKFILVLIPVLFQCGSAFSAASNKVVRKNYFDFGLGYFSNLNSRSMATGLGAGLGWTIDPQLDLLLVANFGFSFEHNDVRYFSPQIKGRYMLDVEANSSWYVGGGMGLGYGANHEDASRGSDSVTGVAIHGAFGYKAYKKGAVSLFFELEHSMILREAQSGTPIMTSLKVGILM